MTRFHWKGNVRELRNLVERGALVSRGPQLTLGDVGLPGQEGANGSRGGEIVSGFPPIPPGGIDLPKMIAAMERHYYEEALARMEGNETRAASLLGIPHHAFRYQRRKMKQKVPGS
jgi:two-component system, NtrC family, response regulator AtoC